jgi:curved DNA-binding protein CbpA
MKPFQQQTYYELLEVDPAASPSEILAAYQRAVELYSPDSVAIYALEDPGQAGELRDRLRQAVQILTDDDMRGEYDRMIGLPPRPAPAAERAQGPGASEVLASAEAVHSTHPELKVAYVPPAPPVVEAAPPAAPEPPAPPPPAPASRPARPSAREIESAPGPGESEAIATAEAALAQAASRVREAPRPRAIDIPPDAEFSGELIRQVRESRGLTLQQIADRTRISMRHLENIEADRYAALPAPVYLRGFLTNIARELGLDQARVAKSYLQLSQKQPR